MRNIVNIVNFIRAVEPRSSADLLEPVVKQITLLKKYNLPGTFLLQYDALPEPRFTEPVRSSGAELGLWLEIVQPLCEAAGLPWHGRYAWDWHAHCGFSVGYTPEQRERLIDKAFEKFKKVFGYYPRVMGSWAIDIHTLRYAHEKYGLDASCNCKDQFGTDGYTMWGGYYNGAYYPSKQNMFCPAQTRAAQLDLPIFRMLGSDPLDQYDVGLSLQTGAAQWQSVRTLEPSCREGGGNLDWVDWYLRENFNGKSLAYAYTQAGQENSFGWHKMQSLPGQLERIAALRNAGKLEAETLGESGRWFKENFSLTPATAIFAEKEGRHSFWYNCRNYRANILAEVGTLWLRDLFLFREETPERYLHEREPRDVLHFDNLPVMDGNRFSGGGVRAGWYPLVNGRALTFASIDYDEPAPDTARLRLIGTQCGEVMLMFAPNGISLAAEQPAGFTLERRAAPDAPHDNGPNRIELENGRAAFRCAQNG